MKYKTSWKFGNEYYSVCMLIKEQTEIHNEQMAQLDEINITSRMGDGIHDSNISNPTADKAVENVPLRNMIQNNTNAVLGELYDKQMHMQSIISMASLTPFERRLFYEFYSREISQDKLAEEVGVKRETVNKQLASCKRKIDSIL